MKLLQKGKVKLEVRFHCERTGCTALRGGGISKEIWNKIMSFRKTVLVLVFFSPSIAVFRILCPYPKLPFCEKEKDPIFSEQSLGSCEKSSIFLSPHLNHSEISVATTARDRGDKYWVGMERNEWLLLGYKRITQVLKCPPVPTQTKGGLCLIFLGVTRV